MAALIRHRSAGPIYNLSDNLPGLMDRTRSSSADCGNIQGQNDFDQINVYNGVPGGTNNQNGRFVFTDGRGGVGPCYFERRLGLFDTYAELGTRSYTPYRGNVRVLSAGRLESHPKAKTRIRCSLQHNAAVLQPVAQHVRIRYGVI